MRLTELISGYAGPDAEIKGLTADSRQVKPGFLFAAVAGAKSDGRAFIADAIRQGAAAVLTDRNAEIQNSVPFVIDGQPRRALALAAARFYGEQPDTVVAVTGTNGKTSTAHFTRQLWQACGYKAASLGTIGLHAPGIDRAGDATTPDAVTLHAELAELARAGVTHLAMEASSHGLDQHRLDGVRVRAAGFTNLTLDHLDYHKTMDDYRAAKLRLFSDILPDDGVAVLNADVPDFKTIRAACGTRTVMDYGRSAKALRLDALHPLPEGQRMDFTVRGMAQSVQLPLVGSFMAMNVLCAYGLAVAGHVEDMDFVHALIAALPKLTGAPGRLEFVAGHPHGAIYVDYAHTPDALDHVLKALRPHTTGRLIAVAGCGGDRDKTKRPIMGRIASELADIAIITDDNPRSEDPASIRAAMLGGAGTNAIEIGDRHEAIRHAVEMLDDGDVLVIAGKGHEQGQTIKGRTWPFDDVKEARAAIMEICV